MPTPPTPSYPLPRRLDALEVRVRRIEAHLKLAPAAETGEAPSPAEAPANETAQANEARRAIQAATRQSRQAATSSGTPEATPTPPAALPLPTPTAPAAAPAALTNPSTPASASFRPAPAPAAVKPRRSASSWELLIGGKWAAGVGAVVVVLAVAYFVKYAYDEGLFQLISDTAKCLICAGFGLLLIGAGEVVLRKVNRWAATGLFAAGVAVLYLTAYASCKYFHLVSETTSLGLLSLVALIGVGITVRGNLLLVGVISIVGGFLNPILLGDRSADPVAFPLYLSMVVAVSLALSTLRPHPFRPLRYVGCAGIGLLGALWALSGTAPWPTVLVFLSLWWGLTMAEALLAAMRGQAAIGNVVVSFIATTWTILLGTFAIAAARPAGFDWTGLYMAAIGLTAGVVAWQFGSGLEGLRRIGDTPLGRFVACLWVQAGALLATAIAVHFDGYGIPIGWLAIGVAGIELGRRLPSRGVSVYGLIALTVAVLRIFLFDSWANAALSQSLGTVGVLSLSHWSIVAAAAVIAVHVAAFRLAPGRQGTWHLPRLFLAIAGTAAWMALWLFHDTGILVTGAWLIGVVGLAFLARFDAHLRYREQALLLLGVATAKWFMIDTFATRFDPEWIPQAAPLLLTANVLCGVALAVVLLGMARKLRSGKHGWADHDLATMAPAVRAQLGSVFLATALLTVGWLASFEVERLLSLASAQGGEAAWSHASKVVFSLCVIWSIVGLVGCTVARVWRDELTSLTGELLIVGAAWFWLVIGGVFTRGTEGCADVAVLFNAQAVTAVVTALAVAGLLRLHRRLEPTSTPAHLPTPVLWATLGVVGLVLGSLEIDRYVTLNLADPTQARHVAFSIFWALYGIGFVIGGFIRKRHIVRYAGLALLGVTLAKVMLIDTAEIASVYRVASLLAMGLLLILTSIVYFKLLPARGKTA
jgi:uncharacterized membrane protein